MKSSVLKNPENASKSTFFKRTLKIPEGISPISLFPSSLSSKAKSSIIIPTTPTKPVFLKPILSQVKKKLILPTPKTLQKEDSLVSIPENFRAKLRLSGFKRKSLSCHKISLDAKSLIPEQKLSGPTLKDIEVFLAYLASRHNKPILKSLVKS